jgi:hypothetical protein
MAWPSVLKRNTGGNGPKLSSRAQHLRPHLGWHRARVEALADAASRKTHGDDLHPLTEGFGRTKVTVLR